MKDFMLRLYESDLSSSEKEYLLNVVQNNPDVYNESFATTAIAAGAATLGAYTAYSIGKDISGLSAVHLALGNYPKIYPEAIPFKKLKKKFVGSAKDILCKDGLRVYEFRNKNKPFIRITYHKFINLSGEEVTGDLSIDPIDPIANKHLEYYRLGIKMKIGLLTPHDVIFAKQILDTWKKVNKERKGIV